MLELAILGNLKQQPVHGYELKKRLADTLGPLWGVSFGSLYPALRRLERTGAIEVTGSEEDGAAIPSTGSLRGEAATARLRRAPIAGRRRKAYRITARGEELFAELLRDPDGAADDRTFALQLSFCRWLAPSDRIELLQRRRAELADRLARARRARPPALDRYTRSLAEHRTESVERDLEWIDALIDDERRLGTSDEAPTEPQETGATA